MKSLGPRTISPASLAAMAMPLLLLAAFAFESGAQAAPTAEARGLSIFAGATGSAFAIQYGQRKMLGISALADVDMRRSLGAEGEARWLIFHQTQQVQLDTWLAGPRYRYSTHRFQVFAKAMAGQGNFTYPYRHAHGSYLAIAVGGGADLPLTRRVQLRLVDFEYQDWPQFASHPMSSYGFSAGIRVRVF